MTELTKKAFGANWLLDTWSVEGTNAAEAREVLSEQTKRTRYKPVNTAYLSILFQPRQIDEHTSESVRRKLALIDSEACEALSGIDELASEIVPQSALRDESLSETGMILRYNGNEQYYLSRAAVPSLLQRAKVNGAAMHKPGFYRNMFLVDAWHHAGMACGPNAKSLSNRMDINATFVLRETTVAGQKYRKLFHAFSETYEPTPLVRMCDMAEAVVDAGAFGKAHVLSWSTSHFQTDIIVVFPELLGNVSEKLPDDTFLPGLILTTSDTGTVSTTAWSVAFMRGSDHYIKLEEVRHRHQGSFDPESFVKETNETVLRAVTKLSQTFETLAEKYVVKPEVSDSAHALNLMKAALKKVMLGCHMSPVIGKQRELQYRAVLEDLLGGLGSRSWYDITLLVLSLPDRIPDLSAGQHDELSLALGRAPYVALSKCTSPD